jgi:hypothetical protein
VDENRFSEIKAYKAKTAAERTHVRDQCSRPLHNAEIGKTDSSKANSLDLMPLLALPLHIN